MEREERKKKKERERMDRKMAKVGCPFLVSTLGQIFRYILPNPPLYLSLTTSCKHA